MTRRIFRSMCMAALSVLFACVLLIMGLLYDYFSRLQQEQLRIQTRLVVQGVSAQGRDYFTDLDTGIYRVTWVGAEGTVVYDTGLDAAAMDSHLGREEIREAVQNGYGESVRYSDTLTERFFYVAQRLPDGSVVRLAGRQYTVWVLLLGILQPIILVAALAVVLCLVLASRLTRKIVAPLNGLDLETPGAVYPELQPLIDRIGSEKRREFTANVSHELKTPLQTISGSAELLKDGLVRPEDVAQFSGRIYTEAQRLISLVNDIMALSRLDEGGQDLPWEKTDLYALAEETLLSLKSRAAAAQISLDLRGGYAPLFGVPQLLKGIVFNLCDNAVKYNRPGGSVSVEVVRREGEVVLSVSDTGIGIPEEDRERVFERFYRVDKSRSKEVGGTGLGLSIVKHGVRLHGASIQLDSAVDRGTVVTVRFPNG